MEKMKVFICPECERWTEKFENPHFAFVETNDGEYSDLYPVECNGELIECETIFYQDGPEQSKSSREWWDNVNNLQENKKWIP